jgi:hypothetical protein
MTSIINAEKGHVIGFGHKKRADSMEPALFASDSFKFYSRQYINQAINIKVSLSVAKRPLPS